MHFHVVTLENIQLFLSCYCLKVDKKKQKNKKNPEYTGKVQEERGPESRTFSKPGKHKVDLFMKVGFKNPQSAKKRKKKEKNTHKKFNLKTGTGHHKGG